MERENMMRREVQIVAGGSILTGDLVVPEHAKGIVVFAHGSGSSRKSSRNRAVASVLQQSGMGTLLLDLLTPAEDAREAAGAMLRFDVQRLGKRVEFAIDQLGRDDETRHLPIGLFGASTGAAAALIAAAERPARVRAVVSRGGRPDLAGDALRSVPCPTLLVVGGFDIHVIGLNRAAMQRLTCLKEMVLVPRATHLFEEPGTLEEVAALAADWFGRHLPITSGRGSGSSHPSVSEFPFDRAHRSASNRLDPEVVPPEHEPWIQRPIEEPTRVEPAYVPSRPEPSSPPAMPEVQPFRERR